MNGMVRGDVINNFGGIPLVNMLQQDELVEVRDTDWIFLSNDRREEWKNILTKIKDCDIHCMNKRSLQRSTDKILGVTSE